MAKKKIDLREKLHTYKCQYDLTQKIPCSEKENAQYQKIVEAGGTLPEDIHPYIYDDDVVSKTEFYTLYEPDLTEKETQEYLTYRKLEFLRTIKNCVLFFTVLTIIGLTAYLLLLMGAF